MFRSATCILEREKVDSAWSQICFNAVFSGPTKWYLGICQTSKHALSIAIYDHMPQLFVQLATSFFLDYASGELLFRSEERSNTFPIHPAPCQM